jgi:hypothetical protein
MKQSSSGLLAEQDQAVVRRGKTPKKDEGRTTIVLRRTKPLPPPAWTSSSRKYKALTRGSSIPTRSVSRTVGTATVTPCLSKLRAAYQLLVPDPVERRQYDRSEDGELFAFDIVSFVNVVPNAINLLEDDCAAIVASNHRHDVGQPACRPLPRKNPPRRPKFGHGKNDYTFLPFPCLLTIPTRSSPTFTMHPYGNRFHVPVRFLARIGPKGEMNLHVGADHGLILMTSSFCSRSIITSSITSSGRSDGYHTTVLS